MANVFINFFDRADGEVLQKGREKTTEVLDWNWSLATDQASGVQASGAEAGRAKAGLLSYTQNYNSASPVLLAFAAGGKRFPKVELQMAKQVAGGMAPTYLVLYLENVAVTSVALAGADDGQVVQSVTLAFKSIRIEYKAQDPKTGALGTGKQFNWDVVANLSSNS